MHQINIANETLFQFGTLGFVLCESLECARNIKKLPEDSFSWEPSMPHTGYSPRAESVDSLTVIYQAAAFEQKLMEKYRLNLKIPKGALLNKEKSLENITRFTYEGLEFAVLHRLILPLNYKEKINV